jgi:hypothetical protein
VDCSNAKVQGTQACVQHQNLWDRHIVKYKKQTLGGYRRALRRADEAWPWMAQATHSVQPHDREERNPRIKNHFTPPKFYCVETICAPCGAVIAWAKFAKSESPTNILNFLETVFPTRDSRPDYVCIDKACLVLCTCLSNGSWQQWKETTRFIVDSYHYVNHHVNDELCRTWCNPAPWDGSAPNLVIPERNAAGQLYLKHAFNTQACEQLNAWLGGFDAILNWMTSGNFNCFLHTMLYYHTRHVIHKQSLKNIGSNEEEEEGI